MTSPPSYATMSQSSVASPQCHSSWSTATHEWTQRRWQSSYTIVYVLMHATELYGTILECPIHSEEKQF